ncbi:MAG: hypothetical protein ACH34V_05250 [Flavobacterium sp.]|uniref:Lipocalin-like domain-containing protein n=1 Tax=Flavobacterium celericrescens TaxID=2709780 RepID=A0ABX0ID57_9FLAO|nr:hypothetical protein [Flavobacterium celericrescens]NHM05138.1 hypothetical protein [Flavobacterium celericrescens]
MKKLALIPMLSLIFMLNVASMCSSDDNSSSSADPTPVINTVTSGTWRITFYEDSGVNETYHFTGYNFTFGSANVLTATNGTNTYTGSWSVTNDDSNDDSPSNDLDFNILFSSPANFADELSDDWDILSRTDTKIELVDVSGGNGGTDYLTLEKN